ncbi:MAG: GIY-YIG nuclease family protein, partial [Bacteroidota bacterium]|nr:GIY-YIG nuclease family protein [Bacteroidota bacterium]
YPFFQNLKLLFLYRTDVKELLGDIKNKGGAYMFKTIDLRDGIEKWYVGKAKNLYKRLRQHLGTGKLDPSRLDTINVLAIVDGKNIDFFKAEADIMAEFKKVGEKLANKIESPKCKS